MWGRRRNISLGMPRRTYHSKRSLHQYSNHLPASAGGTFTGDSTLMGSTAGNDLFVVYIDGSSPPAHTVTIENWQASDTMFLSNLASPSQALGTADAAAVKAFEAGSGSSLTLSDGTTIDFVGNKPTNIAHT